RPGYRLRARSPLDNPTSLPVCRLPPSRSPIAYNAMALVPTSAGPASRLLAIVASRVAGAGDRVAHLGVGLDVPQAALILDADVPRAERLGDRPGDLGLRLDRLGPVLLDLRDHLLLLGDREGAALLGLGPRDAGVGLGLEGLQVGADVVAHVDIGDVDRED